MMEMNDVASPGQSELLEQSQPPAQTSLSRSRGVIVTTSLTGITFSSSMSVGLLTVGLPVIAVDLHLPEHLLLWPSSVYSLACGCCLLLAGSIADLVGNRNINLAGTLIVAVFVLASGVSHTGLQLTIFRALQGVGAAMCFPTSTSILTESFPAGKRRNIAFSCLGFGQPLGFAFGLVLGGVVQRGPAGWRTGFYLTAGITAVLFVANIWCLPSDKPRHQMKWFSVVQGIDWVGAAISSAALGILSYVFAAITGDLSSIKRPHNIALTTVALALMPIFPLWMRRQERLGKPILIPNSLWANLPFSTICLLVLVSWGVVNSMELFFSLFFQNVQHLSALQASIRFLPNVIGGVIMNVCTGLLIHRLRADTLVLSTFVISAVSPLLMAFIQPQWSWWWCAFWAVLIGPVSVDVIYTVGNLVIVDIFPSSRHALAGAVFNTVAQFGSSLGFAVMAIISSSITKSQTTGTTAEALLLGYKGAFWTCFGLMASGCAVSGFGLRKLGRVGLKKE